MTNTVLIQNSDPILITGSNGFIGCKVVESLLERGFTKLKCFVRPMGKLDRLQEILGRYPNASVEILTGNLLSRDDCRNAAKDVKLVYHLAASNDKSFAGCFMNTVVTTRNLLDAVVDENRLKRFVNVSSFAVYSTIKLKRGSVLDETCEIEDPPYSRGSYVYSKIKQDQIVRDYGINRGLSCVFMRPGAVYGPGKPEISGRVGIGTFGVFLHMGGSIKLPLTYVDNCADAIVLAGITPGVDGESFNVVDDDLPSSRKFLRLYKKNVRRFFSIPIPYPIAYGLSTLWEKYSDWSKGQLPPVFNRRRCSAEWKGNRYSNEKMKRLLGWIPKVKFDDASQQYFNFKRGSSN